MQTENLRLLMMRALAIAQAHDLPVSELRRFWDILDGEPTGPNWEIIFSNNAN